MIGSDAFSIEPHLKQLLERHDVWSSMWEAPALAVHAVDQEASFAAQVRDVLFDPEVVARYAEQIRGGAIFPPILVRSVGAGKFALIGGQHRLQAHIDAGCTTIAAVVVDVADDVAYVLAVGHNAGHGAAMTNAEKARHALNLIEVHGMSDAEASRTVGLPTGVVFRARRTVESVARAARLEVSKQFGKLSATAQSRMASLQDDPVFAAAVMAASQYKMSTNDVYGMTTRVNMGETVRERILIVGDIEQEAAASRTRSCRPALASARATVIAAKTLNTAKAAAECKTVDRPLLRSQAIDGAAALIELAEALR